MRETWREIFEQRKGPLKSWWQNLSQAGACARTKFLTKLHGNKGDVSVIVVSGAWQGRRLTSLPRGQWAQTLGRVPHSPQRCWSRKHDQESPRGSAALISVQSLFSHSPASTESYLSTVGRDRREHWWTSGRHIPSPKRASCWHSPQGDHGVSRETDLKTSKSNKRKCVNSEVRPGYEPQSVT